MKCFFEDHPSSPIIKIQMLNSQQSYNLSTQGSLYSGGRGGLLIIDVSSCLFFFFAWIEGPSTGGMEGGVVYGSKHVRASFVTNAGSSFYSK